MYVERNEFSLAQQQFASALMLVDDEPDLLRAMAFASYRSGDATVAAAMIDKLASVNALAEPTDFQNAALIYASVGESKKSEKYFNKLVGSGEKSWKAKKLERRIGDWSNLHSRTQGLQKVQWGAAENNNWSAPAVQPQAANSLGGSGEGAVDDKKMVVVDVVIIRTEESNGTSKGVNLLNGLKVQFGEVGGQCLV